MDHLIVAIKTKHEKLSKDWIGNLNCGITLTWDYDACTLNILMPGYIIKQLQHYQHASPTCPQHCPYYPQPKQYSSIMQHPIKLDTSSLLSKEDIKQVQQVIGSILYYARAIDLTVLMALSTIASKQSKGTEQTMQKCKQLLDHLATHPDAMVQFHASNMILNIHLDPFYPSKANTHSHALEIRC